MIASIGIAWLCLAGEPAFAAAGLSVPQEIQSLYDKSEYQKAIEAIGKLNKERAAVPDVRRLKIRSLL
ncbi:MAG TPA: hypothetical protein VNI35_07005, partial [Nitrospira sp.]|nr:hypothetical protein [Nitrospira sp.]